MEIPIETTITTVTVYPDRARVTCRGRAEVAPGQHQLIVGELPLVLEPESVRVGGAGTARVQLRGVDVQRRHYAQAPAANVLALEEQIRGLQDELQGLADRQAVKQASIDHLDGLRKATTEYAWGLARGRSTADNQAALMRFFEEEDARLRADLRALEIEGRALKERLAKAQAELEQLRAARPRQRFEARVEVEVLSAGDFAAEVTYVVGRAGWRPLYDMRLEQPPAAGAASVALTALAEITQNTGQDWRGVGLTVSTARPALNQRVPELTPWYVDVPAPPAPAPQPRMMHARPMAKSAGAALMAADEAPMAIMAMAPPVMEAEVVVAEVEESGTAVSFTVSGSIDIPGDGTPHKTTLARHELPPQLDFLAVPRHTDAVYRRAKLTNSTGAPLLPGPVNLYVGDEYIGQNRLEYTPGGAEVELVLGVEERITVKRELVRRDVDKRLLRDVRQVAYGYEIKLENLLPTPARVTVQDQYPVSRHEQIKVRLDRITPEPLEQSDLHILKWQIDLAAAEKKTIRYEYQVEYPRALHVVGLID
ncbi:MAG: mucoidy inhibitor MuiA family protein [Candidatus Promineofilum sp.]|nr:mucoidy inhibitor MuiA family protein [Promineifilum sp.]MCW5862648.1 mucoidy inhibitor MuiA family protein [Anaerolineae bacterium]